MIAKIQCVLPFYYHKKLVFWIGVFSFLSFSLFKYFKLRFSSMLFVFCQLHIHGWNLRTKCKRCNCCFCQMQLLMLHTVTDKLLTNIGFSFIRSVWSELVVCDCWILVSSLSLYRWLRSHIFHLTKSSVVIGYYNFRIAQFKRPSQPELCQLLYLPSTWNNNISVQLAQYKLKVLKFVWSCYSTTAAQVV